MAKRYIRLNWQNAPSVATPINAENLNKMDKAIDDIDTDLDSLQNSIIGQIVNDPTKINNAAVNYGLANQISALNDNLSNYGSNANGSWLKLPDGTMICRHAITTISTAEEINGALYFIRYGTWTFPQIFIGTPSVSGSSIEGLTQIVACRGMGANRVLDFYGYRGTSFDAGQLQSQKISVMAIGRWK